MRDRGCSTGEVEHGPLRTGRNGPGRERVAGIQRARMLSALVEEISERGVGNVTVAHIVARSGVSRRTFYEIFRDREECFLAAFDEGMERIAREVVPAYERPWRWRERIREGLIAWLSFLEREPALARLLVVESLGAGPVALQRRSSVLAPIESAVDLGREQAKTDIELPLVTAEGLVGAVLSIVHGRLTEHHSAKLVELVNPLMSMIVLPYLGPAASRRELGRPVLDLHADSGANHRNPLHELDMRLTYRTVRVLMAVAISPGSSNRTIADAAGITDQGQISKLLTRLQVRGLIENTSTHSALGGPNVWTLTPKGKEVHGAIDTQASNS
jgi:AcrR family transcriptional regulator/DNA-binding MarR family transcriptional regulator